MGTDTEALPLPLPLRGSPTDRRLYELWQQAREGTKVATYCSTGRVFAALVAKEVRAALAQRQQVPDAVAALLRIASRLENMGRPQAANGVRLAILELEKDAAAPAITAAPQAAEPTSARVAEVRVPRPYIAQLFVHGVLVRSTHDGQNGFDVLAALASEVNSAAPQAAELQLYKNALWKACGDDEETVNAYLESQR